MNPKPKDFTLGIDLGGTNLRIAAMQVNDLYLLKRVSVPTDLVRGHLAVTEHIVSLIGELLAELESVESTCLGIGVGAPGPLELPAGVLRNPPNLPGWDGHPLREALELGAGRPVLLESDANVAALAELVLGAGERFRVDSLCMLTLGTGVGNGLVLNRQIWHGYNGMGGEAGHLIVEPEGVFCGCGGQGCLEQYASATALQRLGREAGFGATLSAADLARLARDGNSKAAHLFQQVGRWLAIGLAGLINTLNLPLYVVGGGLAGAWDLIEPTLLHWLRHYSYVYRLTAASKEDTQHAVEGRTHIVPARLGSEAGLLGACLAVNPSYGPAIELAGQASKQTGDVAPAICA